MNLRFSLWRLMFVKKILDLLLVQSHIFLADLFRIFQLFLLVPAWLVITVRSKRSPDQHITWDEPWSPHFPLCTPSRSRRSDHVPVGRSCALRVLSPAARWVGWRDSLAVPWSARRWADRPRGRHSASTHSSCRTFSLCHLWPAICQVAGINHLDEPKQNKTQDSVTGQQIKILTKKFHFFSGLPTALPPLLAALPSTFMANHLWCELWSA